MDNKNGFDICIFYLCVHKKLHEKASIGKIMPKEKFYQMLGETYHIPKLLRILILKEMAKLQMLEEIDNRNIEVLPLLTDPEVNINRFYEQLGMF